jgi:hypothetical protein
MAKIKFNGLVSEVRGGIGGLVVRKSRGKFMLSDKPDMSEVEPSQMQVGQRKRFGRAVAYGKTVMADPASLAFYEGLAEQKEMPAFSLCVGDYLNEPTIDSLDLSGYKGNVGDRILITTQDDIGVVRLNVELTRTDGANIECGQAIELGAGSGSWVYIATVPVPIGTDIFVEAEGFDRPGSRAVSSANPIVGVN